MKHTFLYIALVVLSHFTALPALAADKYISLVAGTWLPRQTASDVSYNPGWSTSGTIGISLGNGLRLENELIYRQAEARRINEDQWCLGWLVNIWWEGKNSSPITPYFGGGIGLGRGHLASPGLVDNSGSGIAYQAGGGLDFRIDQKLSLDLGYRFFGITDSSKSSSMGGFNLDGSSLSTGLRMRF